MYLELQHHAQQASQQGTLYMQIMQEPQTHSHQKVWSKFGDNFMIIYLPLKHIFQYTSKPDVKKELADNQHLITTLLKHQHCEHLNSHHFMLFHMFFSLIHLSTMLILHEPPMEHGSDMK